MERVLAQPAIDTTLGLRDRALLETLYSTGVRRNELRQFALANVDWERGQLLVREGKGRKDRIVPVGERALLWIRLYLDRARPALVHGRAEHHLFLSWRGRALTGNVLSELVSRYLADAGLGSRGSCHLFRHTVAMLMLEGGADIRHVQELLGHARIETTQLYAHVSVVALKDAHRRAHPAERDSSGCRRLRDLVAARAVPRVGLRALDRQGPGWVLRRRRKPVRICGR